MQHGDRRGAQPPLDATEICLGHGEFCGDVRLGEPSAVAKNPDGGLLLQVGHDICLSGKPHHPCLAGSLSARPNLPYPRGMSIKTRVATVLRSVRERAGLSQSDLGGKIGLSVPSVSRIENGKRETPTSRFIEWAEACGFEVRVVPRDSPVVDLGNMDVIDAHMIKRFLDGWHSLDPGVKATFRVQMDLWTKVSPEASDKAEGVTGA